MPRKRVSAGALFRDAAGRVLVVEPTYKPTWEIPGGVVEEDEEPWSGCRREVREELGLDLPVGRLLVLDWAPAGGAWGDSLNFVFDGGLVTPSALRDVRLPEDELAGWRLAAPAEVEAHVRPWMARRIAAALTVATSGGPPAYLAFGDPVGEPVA